MFEIGDKIIYPMHGAGIIEGIEEKEILGEKRTYFVVHIIVNQLQVLIPVDHIKSSCIRSVGDEHSIDEAFGILQEQKPVIPLSWKERYKINMDKIKTGKLIDGVEVIRDLRHIQTEKSLSSNEKKLLDNATKLFIGELVLAKGITETQAAQLISDLIPV